jgi:hypothetical protein
MRALFLLSFVAVTGACSGQSLDDSAATGDSQAVSAADVKKTAKAAIQAALKLDDKKKFDKVKFKDADGKGCFEVIAPLLPDDRNGPLKDVNLHSIGGDAVAGRAALETLCDVAVIPKLKSSCDVDPSTVVVHVFDKDACDRSHTYVGMIGDTDKAEDAIGKHHHYDQLMKDGSLRLGGADDSLDE